MACHGQEIVPSLLKQLQATAAGKIDRGLGSELGTAEFSEGASKLRGYMVLSSLSSSKTTGFMVVAIPA